MGVRRLSAVVVVASLACGGEETEISPQGVSVDSAGVQIWTIPGADRDAAFRVERVGGFELPDSGWAVWSDGVAVDPEGAVV